MKNSTCLRRQENHGQQKDTLEYTTKSGHRQIKPSLTLLKQLQADQQGFCLACGEVNDGIEPDASRYECQFCKLPKVYGAEELQLMGLFFRS
jgi:hypothetical protein